MNRHQKAARRKERHERNVELRALNKAKKALGIDEDVLREAVSRVTDRPVEIIVEEVDDIPDEEPGTVTTVSKSLDLDTDPEVDAIVDAVQNAVGKPVDILVEEMPEMSLSKAFFDDEEALREYEESIREAVSRVTDRPVDIIVEEVDDDTLDEESEAVTTVSKALDNDSEIDDIADAVEGAVGEPVDILIEEMPDLPDLANAEIIDETGPGDDDDLDDEDEEDDELEAVPEPALVGKSMDMPVITEGGMYMGPTTFSELDETRDALEKQRMVMETGYDVQNLVRNIINHPMMDADDKAEAIASVGSEFGPRVSSILTGKDLVKPVKKDIEAVEIEAILAQDKRHSPVTEFISDFIHKAVLSSAARNAKPDDDFALIVNRDGKKMRKYPIIDKAHVRNALARAAQMMQRGGEAASDAKAALPKIRAAAKRMGIEMNMEKSANAILVQKDANGDWRWVGWVSNNFQDRDGDILSKQAHQEYVGWLDRNPDMAPLFMTWHTPGTARKHPVDFWHFEKGFLIMSGKLEKKEALRLFEVMKEVDLGMSIHGLGVRDPKDPRVVTSYRAFEVSDLPLDKAANPFTDFAVVIKEVDVDKQEYLAKILGSEQAAKAFLKKTGMKQAALEKAGITSKEADEEQDDEATTVSNTLASKVQGAKTPAEAKAIVKAVLDELDADGLSEFVKSAQAAMERIPLLEAVIKDMQTNQDEKLAEKISPPSSRYAWTRGKRASASASTTIKKGEDGSADNEEDQKLLERQPGLGDHWLSQATGTEPVEVGKAA